MAFPESPTQFAFRKNRLGCVKLSYPLMASRLIATDILTEEEHETIKRASSDAVGRMDDLMSLLYKRNSFASFEAFKVGTADCGQTELGLKMSKDFEFASSTLVSLNGQRKSFLELPPEVVNFIFKHLSLRDLRTARIVNRLWNGVAVNHFKRSFELNLTRDPIKRMDELIKIRESSILVKGIQKFKFGVREEDFESENAIFKNFLTTFAPNIISLTLEVSTCSEFFETIFSRSMSKLLCNIRRLNIRCSFDESFVTTINMEPLLSIEHLSIVASAQQSDYGQIAFLTKFTNMPHKLKSLHLAGHFCTGDISPKIWSQVIKSSTLNKIHADISALVLNDACLKAMTVKTAHSQLTHLEGEITSSSVPVLHRFLVSHRLNLQILKTVNIDDTVEDVFPRMEELHTLEINFEGSVKPFEMFLDRVENLFPKLKRLHVAHGRRQVLRERSIFGLKQTRNNHPNCSTIVYTTWTNK